MDENENKSDKNILKELLNKMLNNQIKILENKSKEQINSLQYTKTEFKNLNKKIENLVKLREEKIIKDKLEKEKKEKEKEKEKEKKRSKSKTNHNNNNNNNFNGRKTLNNINLNKTLNKNSSYGRMTITNTSTLSRRSTSKKIFNNNNNNEKKDFKRSLTSKKFDVKKNGRKSLTNKKPISLKIKTFKINDDNNNINMRNTISTLTDKNILLTDRNSTTNTNFNINISEFNEKDNNNNNNNNINKNEKITLNTLIQMDLLKHITKYLLNSELILFFSCSKKLFFPLLTTNLNSLLKDYKKLFDLVLNQTMENKLSTLEVKYKTEDFEVLPEFKLNKGTVRAIECLKESLYVKIFRNEISMKILEEIEIIYRILFQLINKDNFVKIKDKKIFWSEISKFLLENMNENLANYVNEIAKKFDFSEKNIIKIKKICKDKNIENINPSYMGKLCGTTGLLSFVIKDALEYSGIIEDKKTPPLRIKKNYEYQKEIIDNIEKYISIVNKIQNVEENNNNNNNNNIK